MKSLGKTLRIDLFRAFFAPRFWIAVLCYALFLYINLPKNTWPANVLYLFRLSCSYGFYIFFLLCAAIPYATSFLADTEHHYLPLILRNIPAPIYSLSRCLSVAASGMLAVLLSLGIFLGWLCLRFPFQTSDYISYSGWAYLIEAGKPVQYLLINIWMTALMGGAFACIALAVSAHIHNSFVVLAVPVLLYYVLGELATLLKLPYWLDVSTLLYVPYDSNRLPASFALTTGFYLLIILLAFTSFYLRVRRLVRHGYSE